MLRPSVTPRRSSLAGRLLPHCGEGARVRGQSVAGARPQQECERRPSTRSHPLESSSEAAQIMQERQPQIHQALAAGWEI